MGQKTARDRLAPVEANEAVFLPHPGVRRFFGAVIFFKKTCYHVDRRHISLQHDSMGSLLVARTYHIQNALLISLE